MGLRELRLLISQTAAGMAEAANQPAGKVAIDDDVTPFTTAGKPQGETHFDPDAQVATFTLLICRVSYSVWACMFKTRFRDVVNFPNCTFVHY